MNLSRLFLCFTLLVGAPHLLFPNAEQLEGCWFLHQPERKTAQVSFGLKSIKVAGYFRVYYLDESRTFQDSDHDGIPDILMKYIPVMERSRHFLYTELGWKLPATQVELGRAELHVYFVSGPKGFEGTTIRDLHPYIFFNDSVLLSNDFPSIWIHQICHVAELAYRLEGDPWIYEATAGWMEGVFFAYSSGTQIAQALLLAHPEVSITDPTSQFALGASRFLEMMSLPYRDVIRQIWDVWSYSGEEPLMDVIGRVLALNHLPDLSSYLQSYFLQFSSRAPFENGLVEVRPYSALVREAVPEESQGGAQISYIPVGETLYSVGLVSSAGGESGETMILKKDLFESWSVLVPFAGVDRYKLIVVNGSPKVLQGTVQKILDAGIPAVLEYFHVYAADGRVQIEWKTIQENGVAYWNLYRMEKGQKVQINAFPIPGTIHSQEGLHYFFLDDSDASSYSLEAVTSEGFKSPLAEARTSR